MASPLLEQRTHILTLDVARHGLAVQGDPTRLSQVVANLLTNAAKYTPPGGGVSVRAEQDQSDVVLRVRDTGIGIAQDVLPRVFEAFVQEPQAIDRSQGGLGLGLTIVRSLVERHHGSVSVHSDGLGRGSEFIIRLPKTDFPVRVDATAQPCPAPVVGAARAVVRRVLVVDDNEDGAEMLAHVLKARGHETRVAHDAPAALGLAESFNPDVAILDLGLPVMDGYELAERLRQLPGLSHIQLVALTGYGQASDREKTRAAGFHHHLVKPIDVEAVEAVIVAHRSA